MPSDFRSTLKTKYTLTEAFSGVCTLCGTREKVQNLEVYRHKEIPQIFALFCPRCGGLFQVDVIPLLGSVALP